MTSTKRSYLSSLASKEADVLLLGRKGADPGFISQLDAHLELHELVKVRFNDFKAEKKTVAVELAEATKSELVRIIGNTAILYRENPDPEKRKVGAVPPGPEVKPASRRKEGRKRRET